MSDGIPRPTGVYQQGFTLEQHLKNLDSLLSKIRNVGTTEELFSFCVMLEEYRSEVEKLNGMAEYYEKLNREGGNG